MEFVNGKPMISIDEICWCCDVTHDVHCKQKTCIFYKLDGFEMREINMEVSWVMENQSMRNTTCQLDTNL